MSYRAQALGGNGFVEDFQLARLFRQSPLNSVWEGSGNVMALDILRGYKALPALFADINSARGADSAQDRYVTNLQASIQSFAKDPASPHSQRSARNLVDRLATALQGSVMLRYGDPKVRSCETISDRNVSQCVLQTAAAFIASRIHGDENRGVNPGGLVTFSERDCEHIVQRNLPVFAEQ